jgi:hypothetical protein
MSVDIQEEQQQTNEQTDARPESAPRPSLLVRFGMALKEIEWKITVLTALLMATGWCILFLSPSILQIFAGIVPVTAGLFLGRRVKRQLLLHGLILGATGFVIGAVIVASYGALADAGVVGHPQTQGPEGETVTLSSTELALFYLSFSTFAMIPFPAFGTVMSGRAEERQREMKRQIEERGGRLEKPTVVRTLEDLQGLSLPQLGTYVSNLFKKKGFTFNDYRFLDKDKHLDMEFSYQGETYLLRLSVADKVRPGTLESLLQDMRRREIPKGLVVTSTEFTPDTLKSARGKRHVVLIDGQTLFDIAE